jgi:hypothetical protein
MQANYKFRGIAQLVSASGSYPEGRQFKSGSRNQVPPRQMAGRRISPTDGDSHSPSQEADQTGEPVAAGLSG